MREVVPAYGRVFRLERRLVAVPDGVGRWVVLPFPRGIRIRLLVSIGVAGVVVWTAAHLFWPLMLVAAVAGGLFAAPWGRAEALTTAILVFAVLVALGVVLPAMNVAVRYVFVPGVAGFVASLRGDDGRVRWRSTACALVSGLAARRVSAGRAVPADGPVGTLAGRVVARS